MIEDNEATSEIPLFQPDDISDVAKETNNENNDIITGNTENHHPHSDFSQYLL